MAKRFAFLRAINVGGHTVSMEELRGHFTTLGFKSVETFIASGNVIFESRSTDLASIQKKIEACLEEKLGYEVRTFLRSEADIKAIAAYEPFGPARISACGAFNVAFLDAPLSAAAMKSLIALRTDIDEFQVHGREMYWLCKVRQSDSKFSNAVFERKLKIRSTFRGMNTIKKLAAKYVK